MASSQYPQIDFAYIFDAWQKHVSEDPDGMSLSDSLGGHLTHKELDKQSARVYAYLKGKGIGRENMVMVHLSRDIRPFVAIMGVMKAGAAFTVMEAGHAEERASFVAKACNAVLEINDDNWNDIMACEPLEGFERADDHDKLMAVYTSGTTGTPKGVIHEYGQLKMEMISERRPDGTWPGSRETRGALIAPLNFVASAKVIVHQLYSGCHIYILDYATLKRPTKLTLFMLKNKINEMFLTPSLLRAKKCDLGPYVKSVYLGAEPANDVWLKRGELGNTYSMSESFFSVCKFMIDHPYKTAPIGLPQFDLAIELRDETGKPVADGEMGELCFKNPFCRGYIDNEVENERHFKDGWFCTGDLAVKENGLYYLKGRMDDMVKIDGNRIEPAEIEAVFKQLTGLNNAVVKGFEAEGIVALYYTGKELTDTEKLRSDMAAKLPYYMIPAIFMHMNEMPLTRTGKVDRKQLPHPTCEKRAPYVKPSTREERKMAKAMSKVLGLKNVGLDDDFFALGGNSIKVMNLLEKLHDDTYTSEMVFGGRTIKQIIELHKEKLGGLSEWEKEQIGRKEQYEVLYIPRSVYMYESYCPGTISWNLSGGCRVKKSLLVSPKRMQRALNSTIQHNSLMQTVLKIDNGVPYWHYAPECYPNIEIEHMSDDEAMAIASDFVHSFAGEFEQRLYNIRLIESPKYLYLYADFDHMISDGSRINYFIDDVMAAYKGKVNKHNHYYAALYNLDKLIHSDAYQQAIEYLDNKYSPFCDVISLKNLGDAEDDTFYKSNYTLTLNNAQLESHLKKHNITRALFIDAVFLKALSIFTNNQRAALKWCYHGRTGIQNHTPSTLTCFPLTFTGDRYATLEDFYGDLNDQQKEELERGYCLHESDSKIFSKITSGYFVLDFVGDMESMDAAKSLHYEPIELNTQQKDGQSKSVKLENFTVQIVNTAEGFTIRLWHYGGSLSQANANRVIELVRNSAQQFLNETL